MMNLKRLASALLASTLVFSSSLPALAAGEVSENTAGTALSIDSVLESNAAASIPEDAKYTPQRVLAVVNSGFSEPSLEKLAALQGEITDFSVETLMELDTDSSKIISVSASVLSTLDLLNIVSAIPGVESVQPDYIYTVQTDEQADGQNKNRTETQSADQETAPDGIQTDHQSVSPDSVQTDNQSVADPLNADVLSAVSARGADREEGMPFYFDRQYFLKNESDDNPIGTNVLSIWDGTANPDLPATKGNADVVIAVLDTGVDYTNPDLKDSMWDGQDYGTKHHGWFFNSASLDEKKRGIPDDPMDTYMHGTHVAGIIAASGKENVSGMAPNVKIMALSFLGADNNTYEIIRAYQKVIDLKKQGVNIVAVNNSWGNGSVNYPVMMAAIKKAGEKGILSIFAAGNSTINTDTTPSAPNSADSLYDLHIGAISQEGEPADFTNYGEESVDLFAPGTEIWSTVPEKYGIVDPARLNPALMLDNRTARSLFIDKTGTEKDDEGPAPSAGNNEEEDSAAEISWPLKNITGEQATNKESYALELSFGDQKKGWDSLSDEQKKAAFFHFEAMVDVNPADEYSRILYIQIQTKNDAGEKKWLDITPYTEQGSPLSVATQGFKNGVSTDPITSYEGSDKITWDDLKIRLIRKVSSADAKRTLTFSLSNISFYTGKVPVANEQGTSMAAPVVTGGVALLASAYGYTDSSKSTAENMSELRARIEGGVSRLSSLKDKAVSEGTLDLTKAVTSPYPVIDTFTQDGNKLTLDGYFFSNVGSVEMDGKQLTPDSWSDNKITVTLPDDTTYGRHEFKVTAGEDPEQYGRDFYAVVPFSTAAKEQAARDYFEKIPVSWSLNRDLAFDTGNNYLHETYSMAVIGSKVYTIWGEQAPVTDPAAIDDTGRPYSAILYEWDTKTQQTKVLFPDPEGLNRDDVLLGTVNQKLLFARRIYGDDDSSATNAFSAAADDTADREAKEPVAQYGIGTYDPATDTMEAIGSFTFSDYYISPSQLVYHDGYVWAFGGSAEAEEFGSAKDNQPVANVQRFNMKTGETETMPSMNEARTAPLVTFRDGNPVVVDGVGSRNIWISSSEVLDMKTLKWKTTPDVKPLELLPDQYLIGDYSYAPYDGNKIILNGPVGKDGKTDVWIYDMDAHTWAPYSQNVDAYNVHVPHGFVIGNYYYVFGFTLPGDHSSGLLFRNGDKVGVAVFDPETGKFPETYLTDAVFDIDSLSMNFYRTKITDHAEEKETTGGETGGSGTQNGSNTGGITNPGSQVGGPWKTDVQPRNTTVPAKSGSAASTGDTRSALTYTVVLCMLSGLTITAAVFSIRRRKK